MIIRSTITARSMVAPSNLLLKLLQSDIHLRLDCSAIVVFELHQLLNTGCRINRERPLESVPALWSPICSDVLVWPTYKWATLRVWREIKPGPK